MKLFFRKVKESDAEKILRWRTKPDITKYMYTDLNISEEEQLNWIKKINLDCTKRYWIVNVDNRDVGLVCLYDIDLKNKKASWAYYLGEEDVKGKGIGKSIELNILCYVFDVLLLNKLCCEVFADNEKVIKLHEKLGSKIEGVRRKHILKNGEYHDIVEMGILKEEWDQIKGIFDLHNAIFES